MQQIKSRATDDSEQGNTTACITQDDLQSDMAMNHQSQGESSILARAKMSLTTTKFLSMHSCMFLCRRNPGCCVSRNTASKGDMQLSCKWHLLPHNGSKVEFRYQQNFYNKRKQKFCKVMQNPVENVHTLYTKRLVLKIKNLHKNQFSK